MTQKDENVEDEQQTNIEENEISKAKMKDLEHIEDSSHVVVNQEVNENLKEQEQVPMEVQSEEKENSLFDEARFDTEQDVHKQSKQGVMS